jgi:hypothetical protein
MTKNEFQISLEYLSNHRNQVWIEVEMRHVDKKRFDKIYNDSTGLDVPTITDSFPYYVWAPDADPNSKWGIELRLYFVSDNNLPESLQTITKNNNRHGYEEYNKRINNNDFIFALFENGFHLGQN